MTVLCIGTGSYGDAHPMIGLAQALQKRGHQARLVAHPKFRAVVSQLGLEFVPYDPPNPRDSGFHQPGSKEIPNWISSSWVWRAFARWNLRKRLVLVHTEHLYKTIEQQPLEDTVLLAHGRAFGARIAHEKLGVPFASMCLQPAHIRSSYDAPGLPLPDGANPLFRLLRRCAWAAIDAYVDWIFTSQINGFRSGLGLSPIRRPFSGWIHSPELVVCLFPDWFGAPQPDWPPDVHFAGFPLFDEAGVRQASEQLESFLAAGDPPVVFTRGSQAQWTRRFFEVSVEVCRVSNLRGILLAPSSDSVPPNLPDFVIHLPYVPYKVVLPRAAAIVHHGGIGTTALALASGAPQLVVPLVDDQMDNAARVQRLGAGVRMPFGRYRLGPVTRELKRLLHSTEVARTCQRLAAKIPQPCDLSEVCRQIESLKEKQG